MNDSFPIGKLFLTLSGICILASLPFLFDGISMVWNLSRTLYAIGVVLFFIDR